MDGSELQPIRALNARGHVAAQLTSRTIRDSRVSEKRVLI